MRVLLFCVVASFLCLHVMVAAEVGKVKIEEKVVNEGEDEDEGFFSTFWKWSQWAFSDDDEDDEEEGYILDEDSDEPIFVTPKVMASKKAKAGKTGKDAIDTLFARWEKLENNFKSPQNVDKAEKYLDQFEVLLQHTDNAMYFLLNEGLEKIIYKGLYSSVESLAIRSLVVMGSMTYNKHPVQMMILESGMLKTLEMMLEEIRYENIALRVVYALGTILKGCPEAQMRFFNGTGMNSIWTASKVSSMRLRFILSSLLDDLLFESDEAERIGNAIEKEMYADIALRHRLFADSEFCVLISHVFEDIVGSGIRQFATLKPLIRILHKHRDECSLIFDRETRKCLSDLLAVEGFEDDKTYIQEIIDIIYTARKTDL